MCKIIICIRWYLCIHCQIISHFYDFLVILPPLPEALGRGKDEGTDLGDDEGVSLGLFVGTADGCKVGMPDGKTLGNVVGLEVGTELGDDEGVALGLFVGTADGCKQSRHARWQDTRKCGWFRSGCYWDGCCWTDNTFHTPSSATSIIPFRRR